VRVVRRLALIVFCAVALLSGCEKKDVRKIAAEKTGGGDSEAGRALMAHYSCNSCHSIPGVESSRATGGPSLAHWSTRQLIAKRYPNTPENLMRWIEDPPVLVDTTYMPNMGVQAKGARDIAAYLYTLE
jgi:cytochrome c1